MHSLHYRISKTITCLQVRRVDQTRYPMTVVASLSAVPQSCRTPLQHMSKHAHDLKLKSRCSLGSPHTHTAMRYTAHHVRSQNVVCIHAYMNTQMHIHRHRQQCTCRHQISFMCLHVWLFCWFQVAPSRLCTATGKQPSCRGSSITRNEVCEAV